MFNLHGPLAQRGADAVPFADIPVRPGRVRFGEPHWSIDPHRRDQELWYWRITHTVEYPVGRSWPTPPSQARDAPPENENRRPDALTAAAARRSTPTPEDCGSAK